MIKKAVAFLQGIKTQQKFFDVVKNQQQRV